jgi:MFS family permease
MGSDEGGSRAGNGETPPDPDLLDVEVPGLPGPTVWTRARALFVDVTPLRRSRQFRLLWIGQSVSDIGSRITMVALPFQMYAITHSTLAVGLIGLCELVPLLTLPLVGGALADSMDRRRLLLAAHAAMIVLTGVLAANALSGANHVWVLYVVAALAAAAYSLYSPAMRSLVPRYVDRELLPSAMALTGAYGSFGSLVGPVLGGVLIGAFGLSTAYLVDLASFAWALATLAVMDPVPPHAEAGRLGLDSIREGLRFLKGRRVLQSTFTFDLNAMIFGMPAALFPAVAEGLGGGPGVVGLLFAAPYAGSFLVNLLSGRAKHVRRQGLAVQVAIVVWGLAIVGFGLSDALWLSLGTLAVAGGADEWSAIFRSTILQTVTPDAMRGRLSGIELAVVASGPALGDLEAGALASLTSVPFSIVAGGIACVAGVGVLALLSPQFARYDARNPTP